MLPVLKAGDSHNWRVMSHSENVQRSVLVTIMHETAVATRPLSYSKVRDTFRPLLRQRAASRTDLGTESLVHFLVPSSARNRFVAQHGSEGRPACIEHGHVVAVVSDAVDCKRLLVKQAREILDAVAVDLNHSRHDSIALRERLRADGRAAFRTRRRTGSRSPVGRVRRRNAREGRAIRRGAARVHGSLTTHNPEWRFLPVVHDWDSAPKIR